MASKPKENKAAAPKATKAKGAPTADIEDRVSVDASHPNAVAGAEGFDPAQQLQQEAEQSADIEDEVSEANAATTNGGAPVLIGDARDGQPVLHNDPSSSEPAQLLTVSDPNRVVQPDGSVEPLANS